MIKGLDSFRFFAFFVVFLDHLELLPCGYIGVLAFFVLSGFLLTPILVESRGALSSRHFFTHFYGRRSLRIFPVYYLYLGLLWGGLRLLTDVFGQPTWPWIFGTRLQLPYAASYTYNFLQARDLRFSPFLNHVWSLAVEEQFYLVWPCLVFWLRGERLRRALLAIVLAGPVVRGASYWLRANAWIPGSTAPDYFVLFLPFSHLEAFAIGGYFGLYRPRVPAWLPWALAAAVLAVGIGLEVLEGGSPLSLDLGYAKVMSGSFRHVWGYSAHFLLFATALSCIRAGQLLSWLFENRVLGYLGKISYGLYLFHLPVLPIARTLAPGLSYLHFALFSFGLTVGISALSYHLFEKRFLRLKDVLAPRAA